MLINHAVRLATTAAADRSFTKWLHPLSVGLSRLKSFEREYHRADLAAEGGVPWITSRAAKHRSSIVVAPIGLQVLPATDTEMAPSLLWFATMQCIESKQDLAA